MSNINSALDLITPGCFMASIDLISAYYAVPIHSNHKKYFKFVWENQLYVLRGLFLCYPFLCE